MLVPVEVRAWPMDVGSLKRCDDASFAKFKIVKGPTDIGPQKRSGWKIIRMIEI